MFLIQLTEAERAYLELALGDLIKARRRNGLPIPGGIAELKRSLALTGAQGRSEDARPECRSHAGAAAGALRGHPRVTQEPPLLFPSEAAELAGVSASTLRRWAASGDIGSVMVNGRRRYRPADVAAWLAGLPPGRRPVGTQEPDHTLAG